MSSQEVVEKVSKPFCSGNACRIGMIVALVLLSVYFVFDMYNKITYGLVQYNQQYGYKLGQEELVAQLFKELEDKKCQKIPVNYMSKTVEIVDVACLSNTAPEGQQPTNQQGQPTQPQQPVQPKVQK